MTRTEQLYLQPDGSLSTAPPASGTATEPLTPGGPGATFDRPVSEATTLSDAASAVVHVQLTSGTGGGTRTGQVELTLASCDTVGVCTVLARGAAQVQQGRDDTGATAVPVDLGKADGVVPEGGVLRLTVALGTQGNAGGGVLAFGSSEAPSSVTVTATSTPADGGGAAAVVGVGLLTSAAGALRRRRRARSAPVGSALRP